MCLSYMSKLWVLFTDAIFGAAGRRNARMFQGYIQGTLFQLVKISLFETYFESIWAAGSRGSSDSGENSPAATQYRLSHSCFNPPTGQSNAVLLERNCGPKNQDRMPNL
ncbi:predicted protein [Sclerotinia sclerotiorum 1980 UF-70]|uniref:Uncharacterized protein n=1 Tax=Sclerotinia sclerotiorum (strain ATCC 18683 / 1980 / Ss-1) TaxID=665079 RepID=A7EZ15_SCLS1|nr:predicted protein [Sclerotinia sclerotiorum 1980 UF-70]EDN94707.1 predicted protein [Sclerotinia sclerotiorum 1980 UF-70]